MSLRTTERRTARQASSNRNAASTQKPRNKVTAGRPHGVGREKSPPRKLERGHTKADGRMEGTEEGKMDSKIKIGVTLLIAQIALLTMTMAFHHSMDASAERAGISQIIQEATR